VQQEPNAVPDDAQERAVADAPPFEARLTLTETDAIVQVAGEIDISTSPRLSALVEQVVGQRPRIVFDLRDTTFIDSSGLAVVVSAHRRLGPAPEAVVIRAAPRAARMLFRLTGCERLVTFDEEPDGAADPLRPVPPAGEATPELGHLGLQHQDATDAGQGHPLPRHAGDVADPLDL
jgi:anti-anti-sigma factor